MYHKVLMFYIFIRKKKRPEGRLKHNDNSLLFFLYSLKQGCCRCGRFCSTGWYEREQDHRKH